MAEWITLSEIIRNIGSIALPIVAGVGVFLAWRELRTKRSQAEAATAQAGLARRAHVTELFNRAAGQLRDEHLEVRLAAIYVLREIGKDFPDLANPVFELLQAHLRDRADRYGDDDPPVDVQAIIEALKTRIT